VFEEVGIHQEEHDVPMNVHKSLEDKAKKATAKNVTAATEAKKIKGAGVSKVINKRQKTLIAAAAASTAASAGDEEEVAENVGGGSGSVATGTGGEHSVASLDLGSDDFVDTMPFKEWVVVLSLSPPLWRLCPVSWVMSRLTPMAKILTVVAPPLQKMRRPIAWAFAIPRLLQLWRYLRMRRRRIP
jgi:hypothetical protein